jgi:hypothetical protein
MENTYLSVPKGDAGFMKPVINGQEAVLVYIPIFSECDTEAVITYTFGEPGVDEQFDEVVPIRYI